MTQPLTERANKMRAFHNDSTIKAKYLARVAAHREADEIAKGFYWEGGRGCAVGCTIHGSDHSAYETELGIPARIAYLEDRIFEGLPLGKAKLWPERFLRAIQPGADLSLVTARFMVWLLTEEVTQHFDAEEFPDVAVDQTVIGLYQRLIDGGTVAEAEWSEAARAAARAAVAAWAAAAFYSRMADKMIELLKSAPVPDLCNEGM